MDLQSPGESQERQKKIFHSNIDHCQVEVLLGDTIGAN